MNDKQATEILLIYKEIISSKMGLRKNFPRSIMYTKQNAVGIGLIAPKIVITMLSAKLYIGNKRANTKIRQIIESIDNKIIIEKGRSSNKIINDFQSTNKLT